MCGIAGALVPRKTNQDVSNNATKIIAAVLRSQIHRGPDHQGLEKITSKNLNLILGHNRLSIVDLLPASNQPMWDETKRFCIAYNGMLYNYDELRAILKEAGYIFFSTGDTEVVLKAFMHWGLEAFNFFNGMFAMIIFDSLQEKIFFVRDRFGVKPLFYCKMSHQLYFASTSGELASQLRLQPNMIELARGLHYWCYGSNNDTVYHELISLTPGEIMTVEYNQGWQISSKKYYSLADSISSLIPQIIDKPQEILMDQVESTLQNAIKIRLRSDVPLGVSLSGGIDSATIASFARNDMQNVMAFSFGSLSSHYSEAKMTVLSAKKAGIPLQFVFPAREEMCAGFWRTLTLQDAPFPNFSTVAQYFVFQAANQAGIKVMLGGQGGDEIFMGYRKYLLFHLQKLFNDKKYLATLFFLFSLLPTFCSKLSTLPHDIVQSKRYLRNKSSLERWQPYFQSLTLQAHLKQPLWRRQFEDIYAFSLPTLLRYEDRNSMGNSIESRLPFLDYRLVELALALPQAMKIRQGLGKWVLRQVARTHIPKQICFSRIKRGFDVDNTLWIQAGIGESLRLTLKSNTPLLRHMGILNQVDSVFCDSKLCKNPQRLAECISLAWLATKNHFIWR